VSEAAASSVWHPIQFSVPRVIKFSGLQHTHSTFWAVGSDGTPTLGFAKSIAAARAYWEGNGYRIMKTKVQNSSDRPQKSFEVGLFRSIDAEGIARLFRSVHGDDYPIKIFYDPQKLTRANEQGDYYSIVARSKAEEIIGIHNLFRSAPSRDVYEWGVGLVLKEWRGMGVSGTIVRHMLEKVIPKLGMHTVFGEPVTIHVHMQKEAEAYGFEPTAFELGLMPGEAYSGEGVTAGRVSTLLHFNLDFASSVFVHADSFRGSIRNLFPSYLCHDH